eukprot:3631400-Prymnesium_polylepis.2
MPAPKQKTRARPPPHLPTTGKRSEYVSAALIFDSDAFTPPGRIAILRLLRNSSLKGSGALLALPMSSIICLQKGILKMAGAAMPAQSTSLPEAQLRMATVPCGWWQYMTGFESAGCANSPTISCSSSHSDILRMKRRKLSDCGRLGARMPRPTHRAMAQSTPSRNAITSGTTNGVTNHV